jgi:hypothetical protein
MTTTREAHDREVLLDQMELEGREGPRPIPRPDYDLLKRDAEHAKWSTERRKKGV